MLRPFADLQYADVVLAHIHFAEIGRLIHATKGWQYPERSQNKIYRTLMMQNQLSLGNIITKDWDKSITCRTINRWFLQFGLCRLATFRYRQRGVCTDV